MKNRKINEDWETSKRPKAPKRIRASGFKGLLGIISASKMLKANVEGDEDVKAYTLNVRKYLNYRRLTTKEEWRVFYRFIRWQKRVKGSSANVR